MSNTNPMRVFQLLKYQILHVQGVYSLFVCCSLSKAGVDNSCMSPTDCTSHVGPADCRVC